MTRSTALARLENGFTLGALATLPWAGLCVITATTGRDLGAGLQPTYLLLALALGTAWLRNGAAWWASVRTVPIWWVWPAAMVAICLSAVGIWLSPGLATPAEAWSRFGRQILQWLIMCAFALHLAVWVRGDERWRSAVTALLVGAVIQIVYGAWQAVHFYRPAPAFAWLDGVFTSNPAILSGSEELYLGRDFTGIPRLRGTVCEPLYLGNYLLAVLPWAVLKATQRRALIWLPLAGALLLMATWSRGAWLAAGPGLVVAVLGTWRLRLLRPGRRLWAVPAAVLAAVLFVHVATGGEVLQLLLSRLRQSFSSEDWSNLTRFYSMQAAWRAFLLQPLTGVGWGQFGFHFPLLVDLMGLQSQFSWPVVNNFPLRILCETGLAGFGVFVAGITALSRVIWTALADVRIDPVLGKRLLAATTALVAVWCQLLTFSQYNLPHIWVALGLMLAALRACERSAEDVEAVS